MKRTRFWALLLALAMALSLGGCCCLASTGGQQTEQTTTTTAGDESAAPSETVASDQAAETLPTEAQTTGKTNGTQVTNKTTATATQGDGIDTSLWTWPVPTHRFACKQHSNTLGISVCCGTEKVLGATCVAVDDGTVTYAGYYYNNGYYIKIDHGNGLVTTYSHLESIAVKDGQAVSNGQEIGKVGNSGNSSGPHLYFEVYKYGVRVNPLDYVTP